MKKNNYKKTMLLTTLISLIPIVVGVVLWKQLPDTIATHFGSNNEPNGWSSKTFTVFGLPLLMLGIQWFCFFSTYNDPKRKNIDPAIFKKILWLIPVVNLLVMMATYSMALGYDLDIGMIVNLFVGIVFIIMGNYLHKVKQNYTIGIKIPWTLDSKENWNRTNRLVAWLLVLAGMAFLVNSFFQKVLFMAGVVAVTVCLPMIYSFILSKKGI